MTRVYKVINQDSTHFLQSCKSLSWSNCSWWVLSCNQWVLSNYWVLSNHGVLSDHRYLIHLQTVCWQRSISQLPFHMKQPASVRPEEPFQTVLSPKPLGMKEKVVLVSMLQQPQCLNMSWYMLVYTQQYYNLSALSSAPARQTATMSCNCAYCDFQILPGPFFQKSAAW